MTRSEALLLLACGLTACGDRCNQPDDPEPPIDPIEDCLTSIDETVPAADSTDAYWRADIEFWLDDPDTAVVSTITLTQGNTEVPGDTWFSEDEETVFFTPAEPLAPITAYDATINTCRGDATISFVTSELGLPLEVDIVGQTWAVDLTQGRVLKPEGVGELIFELGVPLVLVEVQQADDSLELMGALANDDGTQDPCTPTIPFPSADFGESPFFEVPASLVTLEVAGMLLPVHEFVLEGTIAADGSWFGGAVIGGELDARELADLIDEVDSPDDLCNLTASFGAPCQPCTTDGEAYCLEVLVDSLVGDPVDIDLEEIVDPSGDPDCAE
jgi:hypothetical protein